MSPSAIYLHLYDPASTFGVSSRAVIDLFGLSSIVMPCFKVSAIIFEP